MSMISEQVKEIRNMAIVLREEKRYAAEEIMRQAANTIESLSAKLQAANMENGGRWITGRTPTKEECGNYGRTFNVTVDANGLQTMSMKFEYETVRGKEVCRWKWFDRLSPWEVIAWKPLPEPYRP